MGQDPYIRVVEPNLNRTMGVFVVMKQAEKRRTLNARRIRLPVALQVAVDRVLPWE